jgi:hypothetical protein
MTPAELCDALHEGGYSGCILTNHFIGGNTGIDRALSWADFVKAYEDDYLACKKEAEKYDLDIIFGVEDHVYGGLEILCYGITPEFLYAHPELREHKIEDWHRALSDFGALCIQAHPFRERAYITMVGMLPLEYIDGFEVYNAANPPEQNTKARLFADSHPDLILISGADSHHAHTACRAGIEFSQRIKDEKELVTALRSGQYKLLI